LQKKNSHAFRLASRWDPESYISKSPPSARTSLAWEPFRFVSASQKFFCLRRELPEKLYLFRPLMATGLYIEIRYFSIGINSHEQ